jgi:chromosome segregation ATPase
LEQIGAARHNPEQVVGTITVIPTEEFQLLPPRTQNALTELLQRARATIQEQDERQGHIAQMQSGMAADESDMSALERSVNEAQNHAAHIDRRNHLAKRGMSRERGLWRNQEAKLDTELVGAEPTLADLDSTLAQCALARAQLHFDLEMKRTAVAAVESEEIDMDRRLHGHNDLLGRVTQDEQALVADIKSNQTEIDTLKEQLRDTGRARVPFMKLYD